MSASAPLAAVVVAELVACGIGDVVLCPGSRSAPLAYALHAAQAAGALRLHVRHDERAAAFTALGMGVAGRPAAVVTTSGTAVANLHPAVLEAAEAGVALVVLTADRPRRLRGTWANQTTALQPGVFGEATRLRLDLPSPDDPGSARRAAATWRAGTRDAVRAARGLGGGRPGPAHLNLAFDDPLVSDGEPGFEPVGVRALGSSRARGVVTTTDGLLAALGADPVRTVVVAGAGAGPGAAALAEAAGWPLLAEPSSGARWGACAIGPYRVLLDAGDLAGAVARVVAWGRPTLSRPVSRLLGRPDVELVHVVHHADEPGPARAARRIVVDGPDVPGHAGERRGGGRRQGGGDWLAAWQRAGAAASSAIDAALRADAAAGHLSGPAVARAVWAATTAGGVLVLASSNAVRDADLAAAPWPTATGAPLVHANRGLAGIDGTLSTAMGAALATRRPARVLVGDLAFLHDANGLLLPPGEPDADLQVVVLNDDGGGIFETLEHGEPSRAATFDRLFGTPHAADLAALCAGLRLRHVRADDLAALRAALADPGPGRSVVEVRLARSGPHGRRALDAHLTDVVRTALAPRPGAPPHPPPPDPLTP